MFSHLLNWEELRIFFPGVDIILLILCYFHTETLPFHLSTPPSCPLSIVILPGIISDVIDEIVKTESLIK